MIEAIEYKNLFCTDVTVLCTDGTTVKGYWSEWFSKEDNSWIEEEEPEPRGESILIDTTGNIPVEIDIADIQHISKM